jgi:uncharacterized damage-inducible protein DinB
MDAKTLVRRWESARTATRRLAEAVPPGKEDFRPAEGTMSVAEMLLHLVSCEKTAIAALTTTPGVWEWNTGVDVEHYPEIGGIVEVMDRQTEAARSYLSGLTEADLAGTVKAPWGEFSVDDFWYEWILHEVHHRGSIITALRMMGIAPPNLY